MVLTYLFIAALLLARGLLYFRIADHFNIIDRPNERSSHSTVALGDSAWLIPRRAGPHFARQRG